MTEKRFTNHITKTDADGTIHTDGIFDANENNKILITNYFYIALVMNELNNENEQLKHKVNCLQDRLDDYVQLKQQKPFLKIIDDYFIQYEDGDLFNLHKPSDIRSLMHILNRRNGYSELQCEYNDIEKGDVE